VIASIFLALLHLIWFLAQNSRFSELHSLLVEDSVFSDRGEEYHDFCAVTGPVSYIMCFIFAWLITSFRECRGDTDLVFTPRQFLEMRIWYGSLFFRRTLTAGQMHGL
jgi:hypothetical protein